jgi:hypothetical protein
MTSDGGARPAANRPGTSLTVAEEKLVRAAARILARHHHPDWRPTDDDLDGYGRGYGDGVRQNARELQDDPRHWPRLPSCGRCARAAHEKCLDRRDEPNHGDITCGCGCWTWAADHAR